MLEMQHVKRRAQEDFTDLGQLVQRACSSEDYVPLRERKTTGLVGDERLSVILGRSCVVLSEFYS